MTNVEQYINNDKNCFPSSTINTDQGINIPKRCSRHLLVDKYLSEYNTEQEKRLVMQNILLMDSVPKENSNRLVNSGTVYKVMREGKLGRDQLTELFNYLQRTKADKSELFSKDYRELTNTPDFIQQQDLENYYDKNEIDNIIQNISLDNIDLSGYATQEYVQNQINNLIDGAPEALNTLKEITDKLSADNDVVNQILNQINQKADKSDIEILDINTNGHEYVDLGLPSGTLWATMNVGATSETDYGNYYQYGKGTAQYAATSSDSNYSGTEDPLDSSVDTAAVEWGGSWHMPTRAQIQELTANTTYQWVTDYKGSGINGGTFTATNGAVLFLPAAGFWYFDSQYSVGDNGEYWSSSPDGSGNAYYLDFYNGDKSVYDDHREGGYSVRPVIDSLVKISLKDKVLQLEQSLATVAITGSYNDLLNLPTNISSFTNDSGYLNNQDLQNNELIQQLQSKIEELESKQENIKHEILTQEMYDNLQQYDPYTVYFIVEQLPPTPIDKNYWAFGDSFPVILAGDWKFGDNFPIILSDPEIEYVEIAGVKWATKNLGAESVTDPGFYFQWGDITGYRASQIGDGEGQKYFDLGYSDYKWGHAYRQFIKYNDEEYDELDPEDDAVSNIYGRNWHIPTKQELNSLYSATTQTHVNNYQDSGVNGILFIDKIDNTKQLFFPEAGYAWNGHIQDSSSLYWTSSSEYAKSFGLFWPNGDTIFMVDDYRLQGIECTSLNARYKGGLIRGVSTV